MLNEQTHQKLVTMKLHSMATSFQEYLDKIDEEKLSFEERLGLMVDREWNERQQRRVSRRLSIAKLREQACIEDIDFRTPRNLDRSVVQRLATCQWICRHENLIFTGPTGIGKTWIACAMVNNACRQGYSALYVRLPRLLHNLRIAHADGSYLKELARFAKTDVLILDDWGLVTLSETGRQDLLEVLEDRYGRKSSIVASQLPVKKWHEHLGEATIADSILDRLVHNAHRLELKGPTRRKNKNPKNEEKEEK